MTTNQVILILLGVWSIGFWVSGWVANRRRKDMKTRLWKQVKAAAKYRAHIDAMSYTTNCFGTIIGRSVSIGYGIANEMKDYQGLYFSGMSEDEFDRAVLSRYWELHKDEYYAKYRRKNK